MRYRNKATLMVTAATLLLIVIGVVCGLYPRSSGAAVNGLSLGMTRSAIDAMYPKTLVTTEDSVTYLTGSDTDVTVAVRFAGGRAEKVTGSRLEVGDRVISRGASQADLWSKVGSPTWKGASYSVGVLQYSLMRYDRYRVTVRCGKDDKVEWFELLEKDDRIEGLTRE